MLLMVALVWLALLTSASAFYNPSTGRWLSRDPIGEEGGMSLYASVQNDPVRFWDFLGNKKVEINLQGDFTVEATVAVTDVCNGGPLWFNVHVDAEQHDEGARYVESYASFYYDGVRTPHTHLKPDPINFDVPFSKALPICPKGRQSGSMVFDADYSSAEDNTLFRVLTIVFDWTYRCDCGCKEVEHFKPSYSYFAFSPVKPPERQRPRPGVPWPPQPRPSG